MHRAGAFPAASGAPQCSSGRASTCSHKSAKLRGSSKVTAHGRSRTSLRVFIRQYCRHGSAIIRPPRMSAAIGRDSSAANRGGVASSGQAEGRNVAAVDGSMDKVVWIATHSKEVMTTAVENGISTFLFYDGRDDKRVEAWSEIARIEPMLVAENGRLEDSNGAAVGRCHTIASASDLRNAELAAGSVEGCLLVQFEGESWQVIPAENLIAAFHSTKAKLLVTAHTASDARLMLEALELGVHGIVLETEDPSEVRSLTAFLEERAREGKRLLLQPATVTRVEPVGMGDRVCVDTCSLMVPGEGLLVGNFARALFLVHSECAESSYIASRPFRVNAGPVHAYTQGVGGRTAYLSELNSGSQVTIVDALGRSRTAVVGRLKVEVRPLVLVEAETADGERHSALLQNAETVRLIGPADTISLVTGAAASSPLAAPSAWRAHSVSEIKPGDCVYVHLQGAARHTGISIDEKIVEK